MPGNGRLNQLEDVIMICTGVIFTCTAQHAAVNFSQYEEFGFPPNYPALLHGEPPADKVSTLGVILILLTLLSMLVIAVCTL